MVPSTNHSRDFHVRQTCTTHSISHERRPWRVFASILRNIETDRSWQKWCLFVLWYYRVNVAVAMMNNYIPMVLINLTNGQFECSGFKTLDDWPIAVELRHQITSTACEMLSNCMNCKLHNNWRRMRKIGDKPKVNVQNYMGCVKGCG